FDNLFVRTVVPSPAPPLPFPLPPSSFSFFSSLSLFFPFFLLPLSSPFFSSPLFFFPLPSLFLLPSLLFPSPFPSFPL
ncbi:hypothetical protein ACXWRS_12180, partial [Streptococcus pyogenes]